MPTAINVRPWAHQPPDTAKIQFRVNGHAKPYTIIIKSKHQEETLNMTKEVAMELIKDWM